MMQKQTRIRELWGRRGVSVLLLALLTGFALFIGDGVVYAQNEAPAAPASSAQEITPDEVNAVAREIWCPLCSGVRLDACELKACEQMKDVIAIKLAEGEDTESIKAYFVEQYGPQVMGEPPRQGFNWLAWILPALAAVVGGYFFWRTTQRMVQPATPLGATDEIELPPPALAGEAPTVAQTNAAELMDDDEYTQKLEEELAKYG
jgi:cytochrome c-type biogenesis protein CcmH